MNTAVSGLWCCGLGLVLMCPDAARAHDVRSNPTGPPVYIEATEIRLEDNKNPWHGRYGAGIVLAPEFAGSGGQALDLDLDLKLMWKNKIFFENGTLGVITLNKRIWRAGILVRAVQGRRRANVPNQIKGLGKVSTRLDGGAFLGVSVYKFYLTGELFTDISGVTKGETFNLESGYTMELSRQTRLVPYVRLKWGSSQHLQAFFGVDDEQAATTGLSRFNAKTSLYESAIGAVLENDLGQNWRFGTSVNLGFLGGSASKSSITKSRFGSRRQFTVQAKFLKTF